jgi:CRISPR/Cas system-associated exonuclease Cas4 (RecB family)
VPEELKGYVDSFCKWSKDFVKEFVIVEKRFDSELLLYTGQLDMVIVGRDDELYLVDLKTSAAPQKTHSIQIAAYELLLNEAGVYVYKGMVVYLNKDGEFPEVTWMGSEDLKEARLVFTGMLRAWHYFHKRKERKNGKAKSVSENTGSDE